MTTDTRNSILDAKANELEVVEFSIQDTFYGINVAKVREIITADIDLVPVPDTHPSISGAINLRGAIIPVVNLARHLKVEAPLDRKKNRIIIAEFNRIEVGFLVGAVTRIHRLTWKSVGVPPPMLTSDDNYTSGIVKIDDKVIFLLDFEKVACHINPHAHIRPPEDGDYRGSSIDRASKKIFVVDDSDLSRKLIVGHLTKAGYQTETAINGEEAWQRLQACEEDQGPGFNLMVTDIEMPLMDGLHLIKCVKDNPKLKRLPCIAFSSIISKELIAKCQSAGADGEISKPEIGELVRLVDSKVL